MELIIPTLSSSIPVIDYFAADHPQGEAILVRIPANDPKSLGLMPGMEGDLVRDDASRQRVRIGSRWQALHGAGDVRIEVRTIAGAVTRK